MVKNSWGTGWGVGGKAKILMQTSPIINTGLCSAHKYAYLPNDNIYMVPLLIIPNPIGKK